VSLIHARVDSATLAAVDKSHAQDLAFRFLQGDRDRWQHVQAVAARADELRPAVPAAEGSLLVTAAWLHDIGYSPALRETGFHPLDGARYLAQAGHSREAALVAHHSGARFEAEVRGLVAELAWFPFVEDPLTDALTYADQTVGPRGERLSVADRLAEAVRRHGPDAPSSLAAPRRDPYIYAAAERTEARL
jgi:HD-like signal output (HDOD) protein